MYVDTDDHLGKDAYLAVSAVSTSMKSEADPALPYASLSYRSDSVLRNLPPRVLWGKNISVQNMSQGTFPALGDTRMNLEGMVHHEEMTLDHLTGLQMLLMM